VLDALRGHFRPEFLNRVDEIVVFHGLTREQLGTIVEIQLGRLRQRLAERKITLELTDAARQHLANTGYDPVYGARPLKRLLQREIETTLARKILAGDVTDGSHVMVDASDGALTFVTRPAAAA
jgi:ATP-dependent Clp protease ATP-binding subunit ClpB